jgi:hypothetical protein
MGEKFEWTMEEPLKWTKELESILSEDRLGLELLKDPKGELPILAWKLYFNEHSDYWRPVLNWCLDPCDPHIVPTDPQRTVDEALPMVGEVIRQLKSRHTAKALEVAKRTSQVLVHGASFLQPKRGQAATMRPVAVRAYVIRKFNPHPKKPNDSKVSFHKVADLLFVNDGKCSRCSRSKHQYNDSCVKALMTAVTHLKTAMNHDGIPT